MNNVPYWHRPMCRGSEKIIDFLFTWSPVGWTDGLTATTRSLSLYAQCKILARIGKTQLRNVTSADAELISCVCRMTSDPRTNSPLVSVARNVSANDTDRMTRLIRLLQAI